VVFLHGSYDPHPEGRRLTAQPDRAAQWEGLEFVRILERYRPTWAIPHVEAVFLCEDPDHLDPCGAPLDHVVEVRPEGAFTRHDQNWISRICCLLDEHAQDHPEIVRAAGDYWAGHPHPDGPIWEIRARAAVVIQARPDLSVVTASFPETDICA
jgi:hypothetical protein